MMPLSNNGICALNFDEREDGEQKPADCPLVAIPKTETDGCEWCDDNWVYSDGYFGRYDTEEVNYLKLRAWHYCPNCGRRLEGKA